MSRKIRPGRLLTLSGVVLSGLFCSAALPRWGAAEIARWGGRHQCALAPDEEGLKAVSLGVDPFLVSPTFAIDTPSLDHEVVIRAKGTKGGLGELFYYRPGDRAAPQALARPFTWIGDGEWHTYRIRPYWQGQPKVVQLRIDFPAFPDATYIVSDVFVTNAPFAKMPVLGTACPAGGVAFSVPPLTRTVWADVTWLGDEVPGRPRASRQFHLIGDGRARRYYFDASRCTTFTGNGYTESGRQNWKGAIRAFSVLNSFSGEEVPIADLEFTEKKPAIPGGLCLTATDVPLAFNRVGQDFPVEIGLFNPGTLPVAGAQVAISGLPDGVRVVNREQARNVVTLPGWDSALHRVVLRAEKTCSFTLTARFTGPMPPASIDVPVSVGPSLELPSAHAAYIPEPCPLPKGPYEIGAYYFCDWVRPDHWMKIWRTDPKRRPALGWYDNRSPEALDWQIKWAVENGISFYIVDWYSFNSIAYFNQSFEKARFRKYMKWALMWCNHIPPERCREEAWTHLVKGWIRQYFPMPEYYTVNGMPYVSIWDPDNLDRANGKDGCRRMLDKARQMARDAGFKGIWFQGMANDDSSPAAGRRLHAKRRAQGLDETTVYHFMGTDGRNTGHRTRSYADVAAASFPYWRELAREPGITVLPNLATGWDDRPWNDGFVVEGKNVKDFRAICESAKRLASETGVKRFCLAPLNEWGEGSYAEPNGEFGFGFFEAIRETFFAKPADGWPLNYTPADIGRGPYEIPGADGVIPHPGQRQWR